MENPVCNVEVIVNPNRKYANTVNLAFFRAYPLYKNFEIYVEGLKNWKEYKKNYPDSQIQIFIDKSIEEDESIMKIIKDLDARVYVLTCPEYVIHEKYHIGLFPTLWRFFPCFDIYKHAFKAAHVQELEPAKEDIVWFKYMDYLGKLKYDGLGLVYRGSNFYSLTHTKQKFETHIRYPPMFGGRFIVRHQAPFTLLTDFLESINKRNKPVNIYKHHKKATEEHGNYNFGVDEAFLNYVFLDWYIDNGFVIGVYTRFNLYKMLYHTFGRIFYSENNSTTAMNYILHKKQNLSKSIDDFEKMFKSDLPKEYSEYEKQCARRLFFIIEKYPNWLGPQVSTLVDKVFKNVIFSNCVIFIKNREIVDVKYFDKVMLD